MSNYAAFINNKNSSISISNCVKIIFELRDLFFSSFFEQNDIINSEEERLLLINNLLQDEINKAFVLANINDFDLNDLLNHFNNSLLLLKDKLILDANNYLLCDPSIHDLNEVIISNPCFYAIFVYRISNLLFDLKIPYIPRIMSEYAHCITGIDIHPGARIGNKFFIDHGTGVVIGETCVIEDNVKIYQGVTLGAISLKNASALKNVKRHPTILSDVTIYANASILGGDTIIGRGSTISANAFVTKSVNENSFVRGLCV